eukprot:TRINITY_DN38086_c0_g1_i1.p1 TRINITY_DN38086_c0_g1~~TRINITY_DN38086_c0_g1_i1.p1  ORF type:complete len:703 (+),score=142.49 TRINITY_DN38086_c0_g1_i1:60-2111(+)
MAPRKSAAKRSGSAAKVPSAYDYSGLASGQQLQVEHGGLWYLARVVQVSTTKNRSKEPVKVAYEGHEGWEEWVNGDRLRSKALKASDGSGKAAATRKEVPAQESFDYSGLKAGMAVQAFFEGSWYKAQIATVSTAPKRSDAPVKVTYDGHDGWDEWVGGDRLRSKALQKSVIKASGSKSAKADGPVAYDYSGLAKGTKLQVLFEDQRYAGEVVQVSTSKKQAKAPVKVSYVGHKDLDEWVAGDRLRSKALKTVAASSKKAEPASKTPSYDYSALEKGTKLQVMYEEKWYAAEVAQVSTAKTHSKAPVKVVYVGHSDWTEWVAGDRLRSKALKTASDASKKAVEPSSKAGSYDYSGLDKGMRVQVMYEETWYAAVVAQVSKAKKHSKAPVQVTYVGHEEWQEWVDGDRLRSKALKKGAEKAKSAPATQQGGYDYSGLEKGMRVQVMYEDTWYAAEVAQVSNAKARVKAPVQVVYVGHADWKEWVDGDRLRSKALKQVEAKKASGQKASKSKEDPSKATPGQYNYAALEKGMRVMVSAEGTWYAAVVEQVSTAKNRRAAPVKVSYSGHEGWDEWVGGDRMRSKALTSSEAETKAKGDKKKSKTKVEKTKAKPEASKPKFDYSGLEKGMTVQIEADGVWYLGTILQVSNAKDRSKAPVRVDFKGYVNSEEWVGGDRLRSKALKTVS